MNDEFKPNLPGRKITGSIWSSIFVLATAIGVFALVVLLWSIVDQSFGYVVVKYENSIASLTGAPDKTLTDLDTAGLQDVIAKAKDDGLVTGGRLRAVQAEAGQEFKDWTAEHLRAFIIKDLAVPTIKASWNLLPSLFELDKIKTEAADQWPDGSLEFRYWLNASFFAGSQSDQAIEAGIRSAVMGSLWVILIAILFAFPIGIGAAIYLEEYATKNRLSGIIQTNIYNLAGVPSIIYGMLGLAIFVRFLEPLTSGTIFGVLPENSANGRTILSAGLTLGLLILPIIIINSQEALKAIPQSLRYSSYGVGATKWQTIWHHVLPAAFDRILTGTVFALSRGLGETAPLVVVGASTFLTLDPNGPFAKFTALPIQIYQWSSMPQQEFRHLAGAAILILLILLLSLNGVAIYFRGKIRKQKDAQ